MSLSKYLRVVDTSSDPHLPETLATTYSFPLDPFQQHAIAAISRNENVLVTAKTGSGKTLVGEYQIAHSLKKGGRVFYTTPIKSLSNQKFYDLKTMFPGRVGIMTGDIKFKPDADVIIMTTEILMNHLFLYTNKQHSSSSTITELHEEMEGASGGTMGSPEIDISQIACVVFDEVHYINDRERGQVWEKTMMLLPPAVQLVMLSATIDNPQGFAEWVETKRLGILSVSKNDKTVYLASTNKRIVPLTEYCFLTTTEAIFKGLKDKALEKEIRDNTNTLLTLQNSSGVFDEKTVQTVSKMIKTFENRQVYMKRQNVLNNLAQHLVDREMLPAIAFVFSRKQVEVCASEITTNLLEFDSKTPYTIRRECEQIVRKLPNYNEYLELPEIEREAIRTLSIFAD
jgi:ATP-dependent RNA helicase DOB1